MRAIVVVLMLAGAFALAILVLDKKPEPPPHRPGGLPGEPLPGPFGHAVGNGGVDQVDPGEGGQSRQLVSGPGAEPTARLRGRLAFEGEPRQLIGKVDGRHELEIDEASGRFESPLLSSGEHHLVAFVLVGDFVEVYEARRRLGANETGNLGELVPASTQPATLLIEPVNAQTGQPFDTTEVLRTGLARRRVDLVVAGCKVFVPVGRIQTVRGLSEEGLEFLMVGAPPTVRLKARTLRLRRDFEPRRLRPLGDIVMRLEYSTQAALSVVVRWSPEVKQWVNLRVADMNTRREQSTRCQGIGVGRSRLIVDVGEHLVSAMVVGRDGVPTAVGVDLIELSAKGASLELFCSRAFRATGVAAGGKSGQRATLALAASPGRPLWTTVLREGGEFTFVAVPADQILVLSIDGAAPTPVRAEVSGQELRIVPGS